jgi:hypothetical protein
MLKYTSEAEMHAGLFECLDMLGDYLTILIDCSDAGRRLSGRWCQEASSDRLW